MPTAARESGRRQYACMAVFARVGENTITLRPDNHRVPFEQKIRLVWDLDDGAVPVRPFCILVKISVCGEH